MTPLTEEDLKQLEKIAKALGDQNRLRILEAIASTGTSCCMDLTERINLAQPSVSHHIKALTEAGLITQSRQGRSVKLCLNFSRMQELENFLAGLRQP